MVDESLLLVLRIDIVGGFTVLSIKLVTASSGLK
jgi:hypothetical protein